MSAAILCAMFRNYTDAARRALFIARFQAGQSHAGEIGPVHLLLGLLQTRSALALRLLGHIEHGDVWPAIQSQKSGAEPAPAAADLPFDGSAIRVLQQAANHAARLRRPSIGVEHLALGLLSDSTIVAMLEPKGVRLADVLAHVEMQAQQPIRFTVSASPDPGLTLTVYDAAVFPEFDEMLARWPLAGSAEPAAVLANRTSQRITAVVARWTIEDAEGSTTTRTTVRDDYLPWNRFGCDPGATLLVTPRGLHVAIRGPHFAIISSGGSGANDDATAITLDIDAVVFEDGRLVGADTCRVEDCLHTRYAEARALAARVRQAEEDGEDVTAVLTAIRQSPDAPSERRRWRMELAAMMLHGIREGQPLLEWVPRLVEPPRLWRN